MPYDIQTWVKVAAFSGGGMAMGFGAIGAAIGEGHTAACANEAISRNPKFSGDIFKAMLVGQAIAESSSIFALVIAMMLLFTKFPTHILTVPVLFGAGCWISGGVLLCGNGPAAGRKRTINHKYADRFSSMPNTGYFCTGGVFYFIVY